jgi:hypothetical protein
MSQQHIEEFKKHGFCVVKSAISEELRDFITQYALFDEMQDFSSEGGRLLNNAQVANAHSKYADPAMETLLVKLQSVLEIHTGLELLPTYSYFRIYTNGDELKIHDDRYACEISASLCFNYSYDDSKYTWPLVMEGVPVDLKPGDLVIYKGIVLKHWRNKFEYPEEAWQLQGFFHYVNAHGPHTDQKWDTRESLGLPLIKKPNKKPNPLKSYITYTKESNDN